MEFVLSLKEGLARMPVQPAPENLKIMASACLVPLEYETLNRIPCPRCAKHDWQLTMQAALAGRKDLDWPYSGPGGDRLYCQCKGCGHSIEATFWFTK